jgi:hypothetical protein
VGVGGGWFWRWVGFGSLRVCLVKVCAEQYTTCVMMIIRCCHLRASINCSHPSAATPQHHLDRFFLTSSNHLPFPARQSSRHLGSKPHTLTHNSAPPPVSLSKSLVCFTLGRKLGGLLCARPAFFCSTSGMFWVEWDSRDDASSGARHSQEPKAARCTCSAAGHGRCT